LTDGWGGKAEDVLIRSRPFSKAPVGITKTMRLASSSGVGNEDYTFVAGRVCRKKKNEPGRRLHAF